MSLTVSFKELMVPASNILLPLTGLAAATYLAGNFLSESCKNAYDMNSLVRTAGKVAAYALLFTALVAGGGALFSSAMFISLGISTLAAKSILDGTALVVAGLGLLWFNKEVLQKTMGALKNSEAVFA